MITYIMGDATDPWVKGTKIIVHICNDVGGWGRGFVLSLSKRWPEAERSYRRWFQEPGEIPGMEGNPPMLGNVQFVNVNTDGNERTIVANMIAQHDVRPAADGTKPIRYEALKACLTKVAEFAQHFENTSVHMPRIGCGLAGGTWSEVEKLIHDTMNDIDVYVYDIDFSDGVDASIVKWNK